MSPGIAPDEWDNIADDLGETEPIPVAPPIASVPDDTSALILRGLVQINAKLDQLIGAMSLVGSVAAPTVVGNGPAVSPWELHPVGVPQQGAPVGAPGGLGTWVCPTHGQAKTVPAGFSQRTQKNYAAFLACPVQGCNQKPPRTR